MRRWLLEVCAAVGAGLISLAFAILALRISPADLAERWQVSSSDAVLHYMLFTNATQNFSYATNPGLGFPTGFDAFFLAQVDLSSAVVMSLLALVIHNGILLANVFTLLTFVTAAFTGYFFFRALRVRPWVAILFASLFSLAPYHFIRVSYGHAFISNYWAIPVIGILVLMAAGPSTDPFSAWAARATSTRGRVVRRIAPAIILAALVATTSSYYFVFGLIVVAGVWLIGVVSALISRQRVRGLGWQSIPLAALGVFVAVSLFLTSRDFGARYLSYSNGRLIAESELDAGKLITLLLPWTGSGVPKLIAATNKYLANTGAIPTTEEPGSSIIASVGIIALFAVLVVFAASSTKLIGQTWLGRLVADARTRVLASAMLWAFLFYIVTGLGIAVALIIGPQIRTWGRLSIVLILFGLGFMALLLDRVPKRFGARIIVAAALIVLAFFDQIAGVSARVPIGATADTEMKDFVAATDAALPDGCGVAQLPIEGFPDQGPIGNLADYDQALPYLYTTPGHLRFIFGSIYGTYGWDVWKNAVDDPAAFASAVESTGVCAIEVDLDGYSANVDGWKPFVEAATGEANPTPAVTSSSGKLLLFVLPSSSH
ncbi:hypothetical protein GCM10011399_05580 [Subtercola lobariae]|uniref:Uncharacterized protein n=1 Tax=Subtercola lobariae TaxID=1588641 RepID=A0A917EWB2_9MICO|nr:hypothetical protein GCM10011399_05580 [Subtercola lobariae]